MSIPSAIGVDLDTKRVTIAHKATDDRGWTKWVTQQADAQDLESVKAIFASAMTHGCDSAAIEKPFLGINPKTYGALMLVYGLVEEACKQLRIKHIGVEPSKWQRGMLTINGHYENNRKELTRRSAYVAQRGLGANEDCDEHENDAVCISEWASTMAALEDAE